MRPARRRRPLLECGGRYLNDKGELWIAKIGPSLRRCDDRRRGRDALAIMAVAPRNIAVPVAGFCTFLNLYSPQALLPTLSRAFGVGAAEISTITTAITLGIAVAAPFAGPVARVLGIR